MNIFKKLFKKKRDRQQSQIKYPNNYNDSDDSIFSGHMMFHAVLYVTTPLSALNKHGEMREGTPDSFNLHEENVDGGFWEAKTKTYRELRVDIPEIGEQTVASDVGSVHPSEYIPFLQEFRGIVENESLTASEKVEKIHLLGDKNQQYRDYLDRLDNFYGDFPESFFYKEFVKIPGVGKSTAKKLYTIGIHTMEDLKQIDEQSLSAIKGIGKDTIKKIREYLESK